ncbi:MAG: sulfate ABC transporter substrate-binding protein [Terrimicrobiaceae bacterium]
MKFLIHTLLFALVVLPIAGAVEILNVSYDVTREFYSDYNAVFASQWKEANGEDITIQQSHGGSSKQVRSVLDGLEADVVTMNQDTDINVLARDGFLSPEWKTLLPNNSAPYTSTIVFLVRKGNPKGIKDWGDLIRNDVSVIIPNPKTSGNGRYSYLAAWAWAAKEFSGDPDKVKAFVAGVFQNVPVLETGGRAATNTFVQKNIGDVLLTFESETLQIARVIDPDKFEIIYPKLSIAADAPVAVVTKVTDKRGTTKAAWDYLRYLWSEKGQEIAAKYFFRPRSPSVLAANSGTFPPLELATVDAVFGGWDKAQHEHFDDGGLFDKIYNPQKP